jgi:hypothetical protein
MFVFHASRPKWRHSHFQMWRWRRRKLTAGRCDLCKLDTATARLRVRCVGFSCVQLRFGAVKGSEDGVLPWHGCPGTWATSRFSRVERIVLICWHLRCLPVVQTRFYSTRGLQLTMSPQQHGCCFPRVLMQRLHMYVTWPGWLPVT